MIRSLRDLDDYEVAELVRKKTEACVTAIVFGDDEAQQGIAPSVVDADGNRVEQFEPGLIAYARAARTSASNQPAATVGYGEYKRASLHTISAGCRAIGLAVTSGCTRLDQYKDRFVEQTNLIAMVHQTKITFELMRFPSSSNFSK